MTSQWFDISIAGSPGCTGDPALSGAKNQAFPLENALHLLRNQRLTLLSVNVNISTIKVAEQHRVPVQSLLGWAGFLFIIGKIDNE